MKEKGSDRVDHRNSIFRTGRRLVSAALILTACSTGHASADKHTTTSLRPDATSTNPEVGSLGGPTTQKPIECDLVKADVPADSAHYPEKLDGPNGKNSLVITTRHPGTSNEISLIQHRQVDKVDENGVATHKDFALGGPTATLEVFMRQPPQFKVDQNHRAQVGVNYDPSTRTYHFLTVVCNMQTIPEGQTLPLPLP